MAGNKSLETRKNKVSEIGKNIEKKSERLSELQEAKESEREWRMPNQSPCPLISSIFHGNFN